MVFKSCEMKWQKIIFDRTKNIFFYWYYLINNNFLSSWKIFPFLETF